ncbi:PD-(D/E)XK nuclease family protein [Marinoscillum sp. MHG1-6]|uniref:PD-(D/E)XK nuclease family protein n=1 Tax=Marinoscillum sp. MHG1-6 TaxID=2959627 RepID=UPI0021587150|nr:PD-(D/E)XK nuclease family protein [Marinoscillum sp. MHG1-6]
MPKSTFIQELAERVLRENQSLEHITMIFPNRRAGLFFRKALAKIIDKPIWMPEVISLEDFVLRHQPLRKIDTLEGVFSLFEVYKTFQQQEESFDQFFFWGEMILRDFNEIDHYLVDPKKLFTSIKTQKELDEEFYFLDEEERKVIQSFWASFLPKASKTQEAFLETWKILLPIYEDFTKKLIAQGEGYMGLIYREFSDKLEQYFGDFHRKIYFAGFNALTMTEERIFKYFVKEKNASIAWDLDAYYFENKKQEAGYFFREYARDTILSRTFPEEQESRFNRKQVTKTGVSLEVGQTKALAEKLEVLAQDPNFIPDRTVIVLPQENMLFPVLHALPESIDKVNITMGLPLKETPVFSLLESLLMLQNPPRKSEVGKPLFYYKPLIDILDHPLLQGVEDEKVREVVGNIRKRNQIIIYHEDLEFKSELLNLIFRKADHPLKYLMEVLHGLHAHWKEAKHDLELEFIVRFYEHLISLNEMIGDRQDELSYDFLIKLFRKISKSLKIPFTGEPLNGLQIMGILETRNLDFDNVFVLNMNEDAWPAPPKRGSFVPYNIRKAFELPIQDHHDAIYAYLFYRLLQRADNIHFYYNTVSEFNLNGEISRLVQQLEIESGIPFKTEILANPVKVPSTDAITVEKTDEIFDKMRRYLDGAEGKNASRFTPSAFNIYLDCRLKFYFRYVEQLWEPDEMQEEMDAQVFGNILHDTMELIYRDFTKKEKRQEIYPQDFFWLKAGVEGAMKQTFIKHYGIKNEKNFKPEGRTLIAWDILKKFINQILALDETYAPFRIVALEAGTRDGYAVDYPIEVNGESIEVRLKGIIDRLDYKQGKVRVLDYKTGRDKREFNSVESLTNRDDAGRNKAVFQVFFYSYLFMKKYQEEYEIIEPGILNSSDLFKKGFDSRVYHKEPRKPGIPVTEFRQYLEEFEESLAELVTEVFDKSVPFDQTDDEKKCSYCSFKEICGR